MGDFWLMNWWRMRPDCYVFNVQEGTTDDCFLVGRDGPDRSLVRLANGTEASVSNLFLSKDPVHMKRLRMCWESAQATVANGN
jgi:hypothetical protein